MTIDHRLVTYGTLASGRSNHNQLADIEGRWLTGEIRGRLVPDGCGLAFGYPALELAKDGETVRVDLFESPDLPTHWERLDPFEGRGYRRAGAVVDTGEGPLEACIYVNAD